MDTTNKVTYSNLKLKTNKEYNTITLENGIKIQVLKYLPIKDKYDLVMITLQKSEENGIYNTIKMEMYFNLHLIYMYTNISFTKKQREDECKLYDELETNNVINKVIECIGTDEYNYLYNSLEAIKTEIVKYNTTAQATIRTFIEDLPKKTQETADIINNFDKEKFSEVMNFAKSIGYK